MGIDSVELRECRFVGIQTSFISWDGVHLTQKAYRFMSKFLNNIILPQIKCVVELNQSKSVSSLVS